MLWLSASSASAISQPDCHRWSSKAAMTMGCHVAGRAAALKLTRSGDWTAGRAAALKLTLSGDRTFGLVYLCNLTPDDWINYVWINARPWCMVTRYYATACLWANIPSPFSVYNFIYVRCPDLVRKVDECAVRWQLYWRISNIFRDAPQNGEVRHENKHGKVTERLINI